ncbi:MAG: hypothetical protein R3E48_19820 [Burkholderiaceae bacterium]
MHVGRYIGHRQDQIANAAVVLIQPWNSNTLSPGPAPTARRKGP